MPGWWEPRPTIVSTVASQVEKEDLGLLDQKGFPLLWRVYGLDWMDEEWGWERWRRLLRAVVGATMLIFRDAFFELRDDRLLKDDVDGSILLDPGSPYFRGIAE